MIDQAIIIGLAAWRLTALISYERGPFDVFMRFRQLLGFEHDEKGEPESWPGNTLARMISCPWCLGVWIVVAVYGLWQVEPVAVMLIAAAAVLVAVEKWSRG